MYPRKGKIAVGSDADVLIWNANNLKSISHKTHLQAVNFNIFEGLKIHGAPEFVLCGGRVVLYEYEVNPTVGGSGKGRIVATPPFPSNLYDAVQDLVSSCLHSKFKRPISSRGGLGGKAMTMFKHSCHFSPGGSNPA